MTFFEKKNGVFSIFSCGTSDRGYMFLGKDIVIYGLP